MSVSRTGPAVALNEAIYVIGGNQAGVQEYNPSTDTWTSKASMNVARAGHAVAAANGKIYVVGGSVGFDSISSVEEYDPTLDVWTTKASMPTARYGHGLALGSNGRIYAIGGTTDGITPLATVEEYNPLTDSWQSSNPISIPRVRLQAITENSKTYAIGGWVKLGGSLVVSLVVEQATFYWSPPPYGNNVMIPAVMRDFSFDGGDVPAAVLK